MASGSGGGVRSRSSWGTLVTRCHEIWQAWRWVFIFIAIVSAVRVLTLWLSPMPLVEDEAWYWEWSRRLEWSYATKGPGIAWLIRASTEVFGVREFAVRFPAVVASAIGTVCVAGLARHVMGSRCVMLPAAVVFVSMPMLHGLGMIMTIDGPLLAAWAAAAWAGWAALMNRRPQRLACTRDRSRDWRPL